MGKKKFDRVKIAESIAQLKEVESDLIESIELEMGQLWESDGGFLRLITKIHNGTVQYLDYSFSHFRVENASSNIESFKNNYAYILIDTTSIDLNKLLRKEPENDGK